MRSPRLRPVLPAGRVPLEAPAPPGSHCTWYRPSRPTFSSKMTRSHVVYEDSAGE
ncbi:hypothetical protein HMPREF9057_01501 [Actinomyces sp. oral taxon 171 str. F0337]|nr:hypothetical protein HMPREF9057_01501 [Actinomyces sp. oral taxon 171 str. F0337]